MRKGIFNTTDPAFAQFNGAEVDVLVSGIGFHDIALPDGSTIAAHYREVTLLPEEPRMSNQAISELIGALVGRMFEPYSGDPYYNEEAAANEYLIAQAELAQEELARREEGC